LIVRNTHEITFHEHHIRRQANWPIAVAPEVLKSICIRQVGLISYEASSLIHLRPG